MSDLWVKVNRTPNAKALLDEWGGAAYAAHEGYDIASAGDAICTLGQLAASEATEGSEGDLKDVRQISAAIIALAQFVIGEAREMVGAVGMPAADPLSDMEVSKSWQFGGAVKALGGGRIGGQLVRITSKGDYDLTGDRFTKDTDFGQFQAVPVYYNHAQDGVMGKRVLSTAVLTRNDAGIWAETQLALRDEYEKEVYKLAEAGKLGWSSGTAAHLVERAQEGKGYAIKSWPIVEASLTPTPAEPRNAVNTKSVSGEQGRMAGPDGPNRIIVTINGE